jgi:tetratricopeptide (TPR) repeat protein
MNDNADGNRTAELLWRQAVAGGNRQAYALLGRLLISGREGATNNATEGLRLIEAGAAAGDPQAMRFAGMGYLSGEFGRFDAFKGSEFFKRAADAGDGMAAGFYARLMADGIGVPAPDVKQAEAYLRRAANSGVTLAQYALGAWLQYQAAKGLVPDPKEGVEWLTKAYEKGNYIASLPNLSYIYFNGTAPPWNNPALGAQWIRKCSGFKMADCHTNTAYAYEVGLFGSVNLLMAYVHREIARQINPNVGDYAQKLFARLSTDEKEQAPKILNATLAALKAQPPVIGLQYKGMPPITPPVADIVGAPAIKQQPSPQANVSSGADARANKASQLTDQGKYKEAIPEATEALVEFPSNAVALFARARSYLELGEYDLALADYNVLIRQDARNAKYLNDRGLAYFRKGANFFDNALADYTLALSSTTSDAFKSVFHSNRGLIYRSRAQYDQALAEFNEAERLDPKNGGIYIDRGRVKLLQKKYDDAIVDFNRAIEMKPQSGDGYFYRGLTNANSIYDRQGDCSNSSGSSRATIGGSCSLPLDFDGALKDLKAAISRDSNNSEYHFQLGRLLAAAKNNDGALLAYSNSIKFRATSNGFLNRGNVYADMRQYSQAMSDYDEAIRLDSRNKYAWGGRASLFDRFGDKQRAISDFRYALSIDPSYTYAKEGLRRLGVRP